MDGSQLSSDPMTWDADRMAAGTLTFEPQAVEQLYSVLDRHLDELRELKRRVQRLARVKGLESLESSSRLQDKFNAKAVGGEYYSAEQMLQDRIDIVTRMRETIKETGARFHEGDQEVATRLSKFFEAQQ